MPVYPSEPRDTIYFMSSRDGNYEIYRMDARGNSPVNLSNNASLDYWLSADPAGENLYFYSSRDGNEEIYSMKANGDMQRNLSNNQASDRLPNLSPDGKSLLFVSDRDDAQGEIYVSDPEMKDIKRLTNNLFFEDAAFWSPNGKEIIFSRDLKIPGDTSKLNVSNGEIFIMQADGSEVRRLTNRPGFDGGPVFSPNGKQIAFYGKSENGNYDIFLMSSAGEKIQNLTNDAAEDYSPGWSPDGEWLVYTSGSKGKYDIWIMRLSDRERRQLTQGPNRNESPVWTK